MSTRWSGQALAIVPTYNESENLPELITQLRALPGDVHVLIVDDNSPDGTGAIVDQFSAADSGVHVIHREGKLGLGTAYKEGFQFGLARGYQYLCTMDADFSHNPANLPDLLNMAASEYDMVVGSRYIPGGAVVGWPLFRKIISATANWLAHLVLNVETHDCTAGFRCYRRTVLETIPLEAIFSSGYSFLIEMAFHCQAAGFRIGETPITFVNRTLGSSKISKWEIFRAMYTLLRLRTSKLPWDTVHDFVHRLRTQRRKKKTAIS